MIYFLYGEDLYRSKRKLDEIVEGYKKVYKSGLNLIYIDAKEKEFEAMANSLKIVSMFREKKLIILKNVFSDQKFQEDLLKEIKKLKELKDIIIVYEKEKIDGRNKLFKALNKESKSQKFSLLQNSQLLSWIRKELEKNNSKADSAAAGLLMEYVGNNLWRMENEIKKLSDYKRGGAIKREDVELQVRPKIEVDIFKTIDALAVGDKKQALSLLHKHLEYGQNPFYLLSMISYQFRNLLAIKELVEKKYPYAAIAQKSGLHPFVARKSYYLCSRFSFEQLKKIYLKIFQADSDIKTGKIEAEAALDLLLAEV